MTGDPGRLASPLFAGRDAPAGPPRRLSASLFSFNHERGPARAARGWAVSACDPEGPDHRPGQAFRRGALDGTKTGRFYGDPHGQHIAALPAAGAAGIDFSEPAARCRGRTGLALYGSGDRIYDIVWSYKRGARAGDFRFRGAWKGFADWLKRNTRASTPTTGAKPCGCSWRRSPAPTAAGGRLRPESLAVTFLGRSLAGLTALSVAGTSSFSDARPCRAAAPRARRGRGPPPRYPAPARPGPRSRIGLLHPGPGLRRSRAARPSGCAWPASSASAHRSDLRP